MEEANKLALNLLKTLHSNAKENTSNSDRERAIDQFISLYAIMKQNKDDK